MMRITQGTFSYLPEFTDAETAAQVRYCVGNNWAVSIEYTSDPHPRNAYWDMWGMPLFDLKDADDIMAKIGECRRAFPDDYIKVSGFDSSKGRQTTMLSFIVNRPAHEPGFELERNEGSDRRVQYTLRRKLNKAEQQ
jgi:ribulose-bisphosphate carboxylase small chain